MEKYQYVVQNSLSGANKSHLERDHCMCQTKVFKQYRKQGHKVSNFFVKENFAETSGDF